MPRRKLTPKERLYWGLWSEYKKYLVGQLEWETKRANDFRHEFIHRIFGMHVSSKTITHSQLDRLKAIVKAHSEPDNIQVQIDQDSQPIKRARYALLQQTKQLALDTDYVKRLALKMVKKAPDQCNAEELTKVTIALRKQARRHQAQSTKETQLTLNEDPF